MGRAHAYAYRVAPLMRPLAVQPRVRVICGRSAGGVRDAAAAYGIEEWSTDWREVIERRDIQIVDICTPPGAHTEVARAAAAAGKAVLCEKPLAATHADARAAAQAVEAAGVLNAVGFNYRRFPALSLMKRMIDQGRIGEPRLFRGTWLSDEFLDPDIPFDWRFDRGMGGTTIADLGSHLLDLAVWMVGDVTEVSAQSATFTGERVDPGSGEPRRVEVDDASGGLLRFASGARGVLEVSRVSPRRPCDFTVEVNGSSGTLHFDYARLNELWYGDARDDQSTYGLRRIRAEHPTHPYTAEWWPMGQGVGYGASFVNQVNDHLERWPEGPWEPDFAQGARVQAICEALERSASERRWVDLAGGDVSTA